MLCNATSLGMCKAIQLNTERKKLHHMFVMHAAVCNIVYALRYVAITSNLVYKHLNA